MGLLNSYRKFAGCSNEIFVAGASGRMGEGRLHLGGLREGDRRGVLFSKVNSVRYAHAVSNSYDRVDGNPCGSSGGSAIATSLGLSAASLGTQTGWSVICVSISAAELTDHDFTNYSHSHQATIMWA